MATDLCVEGPFDVPFDQNGKVKQISLQCARDFWSASRVEHLWEKQGCYVFALRAAKGFKPWYVGKSGTGLANEVFTAHKRGYYNEVLFKASKGTPVMYFVVPPDSRKKVPSAELNHMEKELIQYALRKNEELKNIQNTKNTPKWSIAGVIRSPRGKPTAVARSFRTMMGI